MSLDEKRKKIEEIDKNIIELIAERTDLAVSIAEIKDRDGLPTTDKDQEKKVRVRVSTYAEAFGLEKDRIEKIFQMLIELNKNKQRRSR
jgi:chorismate mutase